MSKKKEQPVDYNSERIYRVKFFNGKSMLVSEANLTEASQANGGVKVMKVLSEPLYKRGYSYTISTSNTTTIPWSPNGNIWCTDAVATGTTDNLTITGSALPVDAVKFSTTQDASSHS